MNKQVTTEHKYKLVEQDYDGVAEWSNQTYNPVNEFSEAIKRFTQRLKPNDHLLGIGMIGSEVEYFSKFVSSITAVDISSQMLNQLPDIKTKIKGNIKHLPQIPSNTFDAIWACRSLIHIPSDDISTTLHEIRRAIKDQGVLGMIYLPSREDEFEEQYAPELINPDLTYYRIAYNPDFLQKILQSERFTVDHTQEYPDLDGEVFYYLEATAHA